MQDKTDEFDILHVCGLWYVFSFFKLPGFMSKCRLRNMSSLLEIPKFCYLYSIPLALLKKKLKTGVCIDFLI